MANTITALNNIIPEELAGNVRETLPRVDEIWSRIEDTSAGVERNGIGRGYKWIHTFWTGLGGAVKMRAAGGPDTPTSGNNYQLYGTPQAYPTGADVSTRKTIQQTIQLKELFGVLALPQDYLRAGEISVAIANAVQAEVDGTARRVAQAQANQLFCNNQTTKQIGDLGDISATMTAGTGTTAITIDFATDVATDYATLNIARLVPGYHVDFYNSSDVKKNTVKWIVDSWDPLNQIAIFKSSDGVETLSQADLGDSAYIVLEGSQGQGWGGFDYWVQDNTATNVYGISFVNFPHLASWVKALSEPLTELLLHQHCARFLQAYDDMVDLDSIITTHGVTVGYVGQLDGLQRYARNGQKLNVQAGFNSISYTYGGQDFEWFVSRFCERGSVYVTKLGDSNVKRYVPPSLPGSTGKEGFGSQIEFTAPSMGFTGIFAPDLDKTSAALTDGVIAPFNLLQEVCPDQMQSIKLTSVTESIAE